MSLQSQVTFFCSKMFSIFPRLLFAILRVWRAFIWTYITLECLKEWPLRLHMRLWDLEWRESVCYWYMAVCCQNASWKKDITTSICHAWKLTTTAEKQIRKLFCCDIQENVSRIARRIKLKLARRIKITQIKRSKQRTASEKGNATTWFGNTTEKRMNEKRLNKLWISQRKLINIWHPPLC